MKSEIEIEIEIEGVKTKSIERKGEERKGSIVLGYQLNCKDAGGQNGFPKPCK